MAPGRITCAAGAATIDASADATANATAAPVANARGRARPATASAAMNAPYATPIHPHPAITRSSVAACSRPAHRTMCNGRDTGSPLAFPMPTVLERFLRYVPYDTQSDESSTAYPSTPTQLGLRQALEDELRAMGAADVTLDAHGYVTARVPATSPKRDVPAIGFVAHVDTSPEMAGAGVKPILHERYDGRDLVLPDDPTAVLRTGEIPALTERIGDDIVTASGTTLLGADNKAGVAEIMTAVEYLLGHPDLPHGTIRIAFTPDEEVGRGTLHFDVARFGARYAYTMDGGSRGELEYESFAADAMTVTFVGFNTHPGYAKDRMVNAIKAAASFIDRLPRSTLSPETTDGYDGFVHPYSVQAGVDRTSVRLIVRDFRTGGLAEKEDQIAALAREAATQWPGCQVEMRV